MSASPRPDSAPDARRAAFEALFHEHHAPLCGFAYRFVRSREVAEELVQNVFLCIWQHRAEWQPEGLSAYLFAACRNRALSLRRHERIVARFVEPELDGVGVHLTAEQRESVCQDVVQWFAARAADYVFWEDMDLYHPEFQSGGWRIDWPKVEGEACTVAKDCAMALLHEEWKLGLARPVDETVERFLGEIDFALYDRQLNAVPCPEEPAAWQLAQWGRLSKRTARRLYDLHGRIEALWPRQCVSCGTEFRGPQRHMVRCAKCRQAGRVTKSA